MAMSDDDGDNGDARVAQAPPLTVTASSPVGDEKSSDDEGRETSGGKYHLLSSVNRVGSFLFDGKQSRAIAQPDFGSCRVTAAERQQQ
jgi:hypothetical protein